MPDKNPISCLPRHYALWVKEQRKLRGDPDWDRPVESTPRTPVRKTKPGDVADHAADRDWRAPGRGLNRP